MRGSLRRRYRGSWSLILDRGYQTDPKTGLRKRRQKWITFRGTKKQAETRLADLLSDANRGQLVEPIRLTVGEWLDDWVDKAIKPPRRTQSAYSTYKGVIENHLKPKLGAIRLQELQPLHVEGYHLALGLAPATGEQHHAILNSALKAAMRAGLVLRNVATLAENRPHAPEGHEDALANAWEADEARKFLATAKAAGPQPAAFYTLALDTGARKSELAAIRWSDLDLDARRLTIQRQLVKNGRQPVFGPTKTKKARIVELAAETVDLLRAHKKHQAQIKLRNRLLYRDHGLTFAKEWGDLHGRQESLGVPLQVNTIGQREFDRLINLAGVRRIKFHGLRHTCATLLLSAGVPPNVVQRRLGHTKIEMTLGIYGHALPSMQQDAAERLAALLHG
jgi:integrase